VPPANELNIISTRSLASYNSMPIATPIGAAKANIINN